MPERVSDHLAGCSCGCVRVGAGTRLHPAGLRAHPVGPTHGGAPAHREKVPGEGPGNSVNHSNQNHHENEGRFRG